MSPFDGGPRSGLELVGGWAYAPGMMYRGRAGPSKMIELTALSEAEFGGEEERGGMKAVGRIGPSKMSTHSLTFSVLGDVGDLMSGGEGGGNGTEEVMGSIWACLEMEDE